MKQYHVKLQSEIFDTYFCQRAANSLDIDPEKKSIHELNVKADIETPFSVGLILGASGSGKTTLVKHIFGEDCLKSHIDLSLPVIEQFPKEMGYEERAELLSGVGLTSVPCWIRPAYTLSNGQKSRAEAALAMVNSKEKIVVIDEWTSVVDRTVAKVMSHCIQKFARKNKKSVILVSCHYDVTEWLQPDFVIDCNKQEYTEHRGLLWQREPLEFHIRECEKSSWKYFSKYHYLSDRLASGKNHFYGLFHGQNQIGFVAFTNYTPKRPGKKFVFHFNRLVIHPDYAGLGLGVRFVNAASRALLKEHNYEIRGTFSSIPTYKSLLKNKDWKLIASKTLIGKTKRELNNAAIRAFRTNLKMFSFLFVPKN